MEYGHHLLVGYVFFFWELRQASAQRKQAGRDAWLRGGCFFWEMGKGSVALHALGRKSLTTRRRFPFTPGITMLNAALETSGSACCLVLWLSLPAARPYRTRLFAVPFEHHQHRLGPGALGRRCSYL